MKAVPPNAGIRLTSSAWCDLVYHTLSLLPTQARDASRLYDAAYVAWTEARWPDDLRAQRTLPDDAPLLASMIDAAPLAHALQGFVHLHADLPAFLATAPLPFAEIPWPDRQSQQRAAALTRSVPLALIELLRVALWAEERGGYLQLRERFLLAELQAGHDAVVGGLSLAAPWLPGLQQVQWVACHPLRRAGRLLGGAPLIAIGVPSAALEVPVLWPVLQGCHEFALWRVLRAARTAEAGNPRAGTPGHAQHVAHETMALCLGARLLQAPELRAAHEQWLAQLFPRRPSADLRDWLASGAALLPEQRGRFEALVAVAEAERRG